MKILIFALSCIPGVLLSPVLNFCPDGPPVCGSDGITYKNECYFKQAAALDHRLIIETGGRCSMTNRKRLVCTPPVCRPMWNPVCGSDGQTYRNECELNNQKCNDESLKLVHRGLCDDDLLAS